MFQLVIPSPALEYANNYPALLAWVAAVETNRIPAIVLSSILCHYSKISNLKIEFKNVLNDNLMAGGG